MDNELLETKLEDMLSIINDIFGNSDLNEIRKLNEKLFVIVTGLKKVNKLSIKGSDSK